MAIIEIKNVAKRFGDYQALHDINLTIDDQEFMVLLGASRVSDLDRSRLRRPGIGGLDAAARPVAGEDAARPETGPRQVA